jgi:hypothetical protein
MPRNVVACQASWLVDEEVAVKRRRMVCAVPINYADGGAVYFFVEFVAERIFVTNTRETIRNLFLFRTI